MRCRKHGAFTRFSDAFGSRPGITQHGPAERRLLVCCILSLHAFASGLKAQLYALVRRSH